MLKQKLKISIKNLHFLHICILTVRVYNQIISKKYIKIENGHLNI